MKTNEPISLWDRSAQETEWIEHGLTEIAGDVTTDVAIIGGGFTGLSTALHCAQAGIECHVIEAEELGFGGSGRNCGLVNAASWLPPQKVVEVLGPTYGPRFVTEFSRGPEYVFGLIEKHQIKCEATQTGTIHAATSAAGLRDLKSRHAEWNRLKEPVDLLDRAQVSELIGTDVYEGGLLDHRAGTINPMGYVRGLGRAAFGAGAKISTGVRALRLHKDGAKWKVETDYGTVTANTVVLGTNAYTDTLWPKLNSIFSVIHYFQLATTPLNESANHIFPGGQGLWDTGKVMFNTRRDCFDRLLVGSMGKIIGDAENGLSYRWARKQISRLFPELPEVEFEEAWHGKIAMTPDHLPRIYELDDNLFTPIGYNGRGIATGTIFGKAIAGILTGQSKEDLPLPVTELSPFPAGRLKSHLYQVAFTGHQFIKSL